jgi:translation elongation factor EF-Tu-like GTPase
MIGKLIDVFEISGRGVVVAVEVEEGDCRIGDKLAIGSEAWVITGIEMVSYSAEGLLRLEEGWIPPRGILLGGASKSDLGGLIGHECRIVESGDSK